MFHSCRMFSSVRILSQTHPLFRSNLLDVMVQDKQSMQDEGELCARHFFLPFYSFAA